ncbi:MAG: sulfite exporter TauE/SafE family protein [Nitrospiraceae bacterium]|nr:sulfite exporter TauE/SafE family protein [Nitrospiraceae bacterium]
MPHTLMYWVIAFVWAVFVGFVYTSTGGAGGVLAVFGYISILSAPVNPTKPMSLVLVIISAIVAVPTYMRQERVRKITKVIVCAALSLASGGMIGGVLGPWLSTHYLTNAKSFKSYFGFMILVVSVLMTVKLVKQISKEKKLKTAAAAGLADPANGGGITKVGSFSLKRMNYTILGVDYSFSPIACFFAGLTIITIATIFGVGGGFLVSPFFIDVMGFPVFVAAGSSVLAVMFSATVATISYLRMHVHMIFSLLAIEIAGMVVGSILGPRLSPHINEKWLKSLLIAVLFFIGALYIFKS